MPSRGEMRKRNGYKHQGTNLLTAIVQDIDNGVRAGRKYHNIPDTTDKRSNFEKYAKLKFPNAFMVIYYNHSGAEADRVKLK